MTKKVKTLTNNLPRELLFWLLSLLLVSIVSAYVYLVGLMIFQIFDRTESAERLSLLAHDVSRLETEYLELSGAITLERAQERGLIDAAKKTTYLNRLPKTATRLVWEDEI